MQKPSKSSKYLDLKKTLNNFENSKRAFLDYIDNFNKLKQTADTAIKNSQANTIEEWLPSFNPISPIRTADFMAIHRYGFISRCYYEDSPSTDFFSKREKLQDLLYIQQMHEDQATYQEIYEQAKQTRREKILVELLNDLEYVASEKTRELLTEIIQWGEELIERQMRIGTDDDGSFAEFRDSIKTVRIYALLMRLVTEQKPIELDNELTSDCFPLIFTLATLYSRSQEDLKEERRIMAADSPGQLVHRKELEEAWTKLDAFFHFYDSISIKKPEQQIVDFCDPTTEDAEFKCLFVDKTSIGKAVIRDCFIRVLPEKDRQKSPAGRIRFRCLSLDREAENLSGSDIATMVEKAVVGAHKSYRAKKSTKAYKHYFDKEIFRLNTVFYAIGDVLEDYDGESIGAASYCAGLSLFSGHAIEPGVYFTGRIDNAGCNPNDVTHVIEKAELVRQQSLPEEKSFNTLIMPAANFRNDFSDYTDAETDGLNIRTYERNKDLFNLWFLLAGIEKKKRLRTLPDRETMARYREFFSGEAFEERNNCEQGQFVNGLLYLISVMAPYEDIDIKAYAKGVDELGPDAQVPFIDYNVLSGLVTDSNGELSSTVEYLEKRDVISGDADAFETNTDVQKFIREQLNDEKMASIAKLYDDLFDSVVETDPNGSLIPHVHEWVKFANHYKIKDAEPEKIIEKLTSFHLEQYQSIYFPKDESAVLAESAGKFESIQFLIEDYKTGLKNRGQAHNKPLSQNLERGRQAIDYLIQEIDTTKGVVEQHKPERYANEELIMLHFKQLVRISKTEKFDTLTSFKLVFHSQTLAGLINPIQPDPISKTLLDKHRKQNPLADLTDKTVLAKLIVKTFVEKWVNEKYGDPEKHAHQYRKAARLIERFMKN